MLFLLKSSSYAHIRALISPLSYIIKNIIPILLAQDTQSVYLLATGWTVRESNPGGGEIFNTRPDLPWGPPSLLYSVTGSFSVVKRPGPCVDRPPHIAPRLKKEQSYTSTPLWAFMACSRVNFTFYSYITCLKCALNFFQIVAKSAIWSFYLDMPSNANKSPLINVHSIHDDFILRAEHKVCLLSRM